VAKSCAVTPASEERGGRPAVLASALSAAVVVIAAVIAVSLLLIAHQMSRQNCIRTAEARYPTVPVSAFVGGTRRDVGPLKVSFAVERARAVAGC